MKTIKVGVKQRHLDIPEGWEQVQLGTAKEGDKFANVQASRPYWVETTAEDWGDPVDWFDALIRKSNNLYIEPADL